MKNLKIGHKLMVLLGLLLALNLGVTVKNIYSMVSIGAQGRLIGEDWLPSVQLLGEIDTATSNFRIAELQHAASTDVTITTDAEHDLGQITEELEKSFISYQKVINTEEEREFWNSFQEKWKEYTALHKDFMWYERANRKAEATTMLMGRMKELMDEMSQILEKDVKLNNEGANKAVHEAERIYTQESTNAVIAAIIAVAFAIYIKISLSRNIAVPIRRLKDFMEVLQSGHYDAPVPISGRRDEVGEMAIAVEEFRKGLITQRELENQQKLEAQRKLDRQARVDTLVTAFDASASNTVSTVASASTELSVTASDLSRIAHSSNTQVGDVATASGNTSASVQSVAASVEEMSASVREISKQVARSVEIAQVAGNEAKEANQTSQDMLEASKAIGEVTELIESIAGQINLLALNATIESARAGDAGKGFAVVASEIKNLANQTTRATDEIRDKLESMRSMAQKVATALVKLVESVNQINSASGGIASAIEEQSAVTQEIASNMTTTATAVDKINSNVSGIQESTRSTASATEQIKSASEMLSQQAEDLSSQVRQFLDNLRAA